MDWIMAPVAAFRSLDFVAEDDTCSGGGATLNSCSCTGGLLVCNCSGCLTAPPPKGRD